MNALVLLRHGQSVWNLENRFTGWVDVDLTKKGEDEAKAAGKAMAAEGLRFDRVVTSTQSRAQHTARLALAKMAAAGVDMAAVKAGDGWDLQEDLRLRERNYGDLAGLNKAETAEKHGEEQVRIWRRSYDQPPPGGESLKDVVIRVTPYYDEVLKPKLSTGESVLVAAHGNSLRALLVALGVHRESEIPNVEVPTGRPYVFQMDGATRVGEGRYLGG